MGRLARIDHSHWKVHIPAAMAADIERQTLQFLTVLAAQLLHPLSFIHANQPALASQGCSCWFKADHQGPL